MARHHGSKGQVKMDPTGGATAAAVGDLNGGRWTWTETRRTSPVSATPTSSTCSASPTSRGDQRRLG